MISLTNSSPLSRQEAASELLLRRRARSNLLDFTQYTMPDYDANWHHQVVCEYLDAFVRLEITRLIVCMPPRYGKSELVSRRMPAYILGRDPQANIITASYGADLSRRMNRDVQRIIDDERYRALFPETTLSGKNIRTVAGGTWLRNSELFEVVEYGGQYRSAGVGGAITGMGMLYGIIDDPIKNREEANSERIREKVWDWYTSTFRTRLAPGGAILVTVTRWHEDDLVGRLLELAKTDSRADAWTVVSLPAIAEESAPDYDRREPGEPLWPDQYSVEDLESTRVSLGSYDWNSLYQQRPSPREGGMFKRHQFQIAGDRVPATPWRVRYWDKAASTSTTAKYTAGVRLAITDQGEVIIEHVVRGQWSTGERRQVMQQVAESDAAQFDNSVVTFIEQEPGSSGLDSVQDEIRLLAGYPVFADRPSGDKDTRMLPLVAQAEAGNLYMMAGAWNDQYVDELCTLPNGRYRDQADASSGAFNCLLEMMHSQAEGTYVHDEPLSISPF